MKEKIMSQNFVNYTLKKEIKCLSKETKNIDKSA